MLDLKIPLKMIPTEVGAGDHTERWIALGRVTENVWSRAARRRRQKPQNQQQKQEGDPIKPPEMGSPNEDDDDDDEEPPAMVFKLILLGETTEEEENPNVDITIRWMQGNDSVLFESFCGMVKREMMSRGK